MLSLFTYRSPLSTPTLAPSPLLKPSGENNLAAPLRGQVLPPYVARRPVDAQVYSTLPSSPQCPLPSLSPRRGWSVSRRPDEISQRNRRNGKALPIEIAEIFPRQLAYPIGRNGTRPTVFSHWQILGIPINRRRGRIDELPNTLPLTNLQEPFG